MYTRTPAGGPLAGGTRVEIRGEGLNGYGAVIDKINNELIDTNMAERDEPSCEPDPKNVQPLRLSQRVLSAHRFMKSAASACACCVTCWLP